MSLTVARKKYLMIYYNTDGNSNRFHVAASKLTSGMDHKISYFLKLNYNKTVLHNILLRKI